MQMTRAKRFGYGPCYGSHANLAEVGDTIPIAKVRVDLDVDTYVWASGVRSNQVDVLDC
jgi:hypothetical protein